MPRFDVHQAMFVNSHLLGKSVVRVGGDNAVQAAINWVKMHNWPKADEKEVRILGNTTKEIEVQFFLNSGADNVVVTMIPVESTSQCKDCGHPKEAPNPVCYGECEEFRQSRSVIIRTDDAEAMLQEAF